MKSTGTFPSEQEIPEKVSPDLMRQIYYDLIEFNDYLSWGNKLNPNFKLITINDDDKRLENEKYIDCIGEPMKTLYKHCCPHKRCDVPKYEDLEIQECLDLRAKNEEYKKACESDDRKE